MGICMSGGPIQKKRLLNFLLLIVFVAGIAANWSCSASLMQSSKAHCKKSQHVDDGITKPVSGSCHMRPCHAREAKLFLLPDSPSRRLQNEHRHSVPISSESFSSSSILADRRWFKWPGGEPRPPSSLSPPPLFLVQCAIIC